MAEETAWANEFVEFWNTTLVPKFMRFRHVLVDGLGKHSRVVFEQQPVANPGEKVLDVGAGFGDTAIELARRVGPNGRVTALDCCQAFLDCGIADARDAGVDNIDWLEADAESHAFEPDHDFWFSRFGTMFFAMPVIALRNLRKALKPDGRMMMIVWRDREDNPWTHLPREVVLRYLPEPDDPDTCGPGPFSMASTSLVTKQLEAAGYRDIEFQRNDAPIMVGHSIEDAINFQLAIGPAGEIYREAGELAEQRRDEIVGALTEALQPYLTDEGVVLPSSSWCVTARPA